MRLIDADDFMERMKCDTDLCAEMEQDGLKALKKYLDLQPTAYDVDKVVDELQCDKCESCSFIEVCAGSKCCTECHKKIIEIVKQGGVSDDVCMWREEGLGLITSCGDLVRAYSDDFKYCPYCSRKIEVTK